MKKYKVEQVWIHKGNTCVVIMTSMGHRCGYVGISINHILYEERYDEKVEYLSDLKEALGKAEVGKRGIIDVLLFSYRDGVSPVMLFDVHGSLTYSNNNPLYPINLRYNFQLKHRSKATIFYTPWWYGFDCAHHGDATDMTVVDDFTKKLNLKCPTGDVLRSLEYCINECNNLSSQLEDIKDD